MWAWKGRTFGKFSGRFGRTRIGSTRVSDTLALLLDAPVILLPNLDRPCRRLFLGGGEFVEFFFRLGQVADGLHCHVRFHAGELFSLHYERHVWRSGVFFLQRVELFE